MLIQANAFNIALKDKSVHCAVTSPPYYSLRKYAGEQERTFKDEWTGAYGLEPTLQLYIDHTVEWCREVWRVLRDDGTFWLNIGDSYSGSGKGPGKKMNKEQHHMGDEGGKVPDGTKPKDLMGVPWRVALALQADGWYLRSDIIWYKPNPMPESVTDRPTKSHEYVFLLTKKSKYFYDADAVREPHIASPKSYESAAKTQREKRGKNFIVASGGTETHFVNPQNPSGRNKRTVWTIATAPYKGAHFATYPPALVEPCIKAGTSEKGVCPECGNPWERVVEATGGTIGKGWHDHDNDLELGHRDKSNGKATDGTYKRSTLGWQPTCSHYDELYRSEFPQARKARKRH